MNPNLQAAQNDFDADAQEILTLQSQVSDLTQKLAQVPSTASPLITQFKNIEAMAGWIWPKGTEGNSGGTGNTGVATWNYDAEFGAATASVTPTLPKVDPSHSANYNAYFFNPLAGMDSNTGKPLQFPVITPKANVFQYHAEYLVDAANWGQRNALENEIRWHNGQGFRHVMASQLLLGSKPQVRIWDWQQKWVPTTVPCNMRPDSRYSIDTLFTVNPATGATTCIGFTIENKFFPWGKVQAPNPYGGTHWFLASVQPDSNPSGDPFTYQVRNLHVTIL